MNIQIIIVMCITTSFCASGFSDNDNAIYRKFSNLLKTVYKIIDYYEGQYMNMNIDGIFGLRVLEGELFSLIFSQNSNHHLYGKMMKSKWKVVQKTLSEASLSLEEKNRDRYNELGYLIKVAWLPMHSYYFVSHKLVWPKDKQKSHTEEIITETLSDQCITELVTRKDNQRCNVSEQCVKMMLLNNGLYGYQLTHQVLYISLVQRMYCQYKVKSMLLYLNASQDIIFMKHVFCANMYHEVNETIHKFNYDIPIQFQDLLLEQIFTCGGSGYLQFADLRLLEKVILWQDKNKGCFTDLVQPLQHRRRRHLLEEIELKDGCLAHKTSLALAALTVYLHLLIRSEHVEYSGLPDYASILRAEILRLQRRFLPPLLSDPEQSSRDAVEYIERPYKVLVSLDNVYLPKSLEVNENIPWNSILENRKWDDDESGVGGGGGGAAAASLSLKLIILGLFISLTLLLLINCKARLRLRTFLSLFMR